MKVSVIIPVYNTGKVLDKCLNSVCQQTYKDLEIIVVNDHSSDETTNQLVRKWARQDSRVVCVENNINLGIEKTRFVALGHVHGEGLMFVDHDDWFADKCVIERMVHNMDKTGADLIMARSIERLNMFWKKNTYDPIKAGVYIGESVRKLFVSFFGYSLVPVLVWAKLYRTSIIQQANMHPHGVRYSDDLLFNLFVWPYIQKFSVIDDIVYVHNFGGFSSRYSNAMKEYHNLYDIRMDVIKQEALYQYKRLLDIEMKFVLQVDVKKQMEFGLSPELALQSLRLELQHPHWQQVVLSLKDSKDVFDHELVRGDAEAMFQIILKDYNSLHARTKRIVRKLALI